MPEKLVERSKKAQRKDLVAGTGLWVAQIRLMIVSGLMAGQVECLVVIAVTAAFDAGEAGQMEIGWQKLGYLVYSDCNTVACLGSALM